MMAVDTYIKCSFGKRSGTNIHNDFYERTSSGKHHSAIKSLDMELASDMYGFPPINTNSIGRPYRKKRQAEIWTNFERFEGGE